MSCRPPLRKTRERCGTPLPRSRSPDPTTQGRLRLQNLLEVGSGLVRLRDADVGRSRESARQARFVKLTAWVWAVAALVSWRALTKAPSAAYLPLPHVDPFLLTIMVFFGAMIALGVGQQLLTGKSRTSSTAPTKSPPASLGLLAHGDRDDVYTRSRTELQALIQIAFGGQCAEELFFGDVSTGPGGDLLYATNCAPEMVGAHGMDTSLVSYMAVQNSAFSDTNIVGRVLADDRGRDAVEALLARHKATAKALLEQNRHLVEALRDALLQRDELLGSEITDVLEAAARPMVVDLREVDEVVEH